MTFYSYDAAQRTLTASWETGSGPVVSTFAAATEAVSPNRLLALTAALGHLSQAAWRTYTRPASVGRSFEMHRERWEREREHEPFAEVVTCVRNPELADEDLMKGHHSPVIASGHRIGRALHFIGDTGLGAEVTHEVEAELAAIEQAERGDFSGRAQQAVLLTRQEAAPGHVAAADALLHDAPFGTEELFTRVEPTAAAVAAAHWLQAAADVVAESSGRNPVTVVVEADKIEPLPFESATRVLGIVNRGASPRRAAAGLIHDALNGAEDEVPDTRGLLTRVDNAEEATRQHADRHALADELRGMPLVPHRPARDLLDDLLTGIRACQLLFVADAGIPEESTDGEEDWYAEDADDLADELRHVFIERLRAEAAEEHDRLV